MFTINQHQIENKEDLLTLPCNLEHEENVIFFLAEWFNNSPTVKTTTSGSTGKPKIIELQKSAMLKSAELTCSFLNLKKNQIGLLCLPTNFIAGKMMLVRALYAELNLISVSPSRNPLKDINTNIDFAAMTPMQVNSVLIENPEKLALINILIIGGAPVDSLLEHKLAKFNTRCFSTFGMTETITHIALKELNKSNCFEAVPSVTFDKTFDDCLIINAPHISNQQIITNDKVTLLSSTRFIWIGRKDNVINTGGIKIQAEELELQISESIPDHRFYISTLKDELLGEKIILIIEAAESFDLSSINLNHLNKYCIPKEVYKLSKFKETETGKILRKQNKELLGLI